MVGLFITATDTGAGKTYCAALLLRHLREGRGLDAVGFKPICCGSREDAETLHAASGGDAVLSLNEVNPVWLRTPAAPYTAAMVEGRPVDLAMVRETFSRLRARHGLVVVEGIGGWRVPIERSFSVADLAVEMALPVVVVVRNRLGALNHAALTVEAVRATELACAGFVFNEGPPEAFDEVEGVARATNGAVCEELLGVPRLAGVETGQLVWTPQVPFP